MEGKWLVMTINFTVAHIPGILKTADSFAFAKNPNEKFLWQDVPTQPIEVSESTLNQ